MDLKKSIRRAKIKQVLVIGGLSILTTFILLGVIVFALDKISTKNYKVLNETLFDYQQIASPNTQIDSQVISYSSIFGGEVVSNQSKNIDGYIMPWSNLRSRYGVIRNEIDANEQFPSWYHTSTNSYEYNRQTKQKVATFYHPNVTDYYYGGQNELETIGDLENQVAEVAISFDKAYPYSRIKNLIPDNLNVVWLYLFSEEKNEKMGPSGSPVYGFQLDKDETNKITDANADREDFFRTFKSYTSSMNQKEITSFINENQDKPIDDLPVLGVMVTGQTKNLSQLKDESFIRGSSIGVTVPIVPYITPEK